MKQKEYLLSSLMIAFVAGFIYYAFADSEIIKKLPALAYQTVLSVADNRESTDETKDMNRLNQKESEPIYKGEETVVLIPSKVSALASFGVNIPDFSNFIRVPDFGGGIIPYSGNVLPERYHSGDFHPGGRSDYQPKISGYIFYQK